jgi:hypothetical protein
LTNVTDADSADDPDPNSMATASPCAASRLAVAHLAVALVAIFAAGASIAQWPAIRAGGHPLEVCHVADWVAGAAVAYLLVTALAEFRAELRLRRGAASSRCAGLRLCGHVVVLGTSLAAIGRGWNSLALLAGLDTILSALAAVSLLTLGVGLLDRRMLRRPPQGASPAVGPRSARSLVWLGCEWAAALCFAGLLFYLELQPEPHSQLRSCRETIDLPAALALHGDPLKEGR